MLSAVNQRMPSKTPLSTWLSQALVAYVIELDNEFEERFARAGAGARVVSVAMWSNLLRFVGDGISVGELPAAVGAPKSRVLSTLGGMERWRYITLDTGRRGSAGGESKRDGFGSARGLDGSWIVRPAPAGRRAEAIWRTLFDDIDARWSERFGADAIEELADSLRAIDAELDADLPDALPILGSANGMVIDLPAGRRNPAAAAHLYALLSRTLLAYAVDFERESPLSLALSANVVRVLDEEGVLVRDLPGASGISKEATSMALTYLVKSRHVAVEGTTAGTKSARLTPDGRAARALFPALHADLEKQWCARFGGDTVRGLRSSLERLLAQRDVLANGLEPYPDGWRASKPYVAHTRAVLDDPTARLPHSPMVLHRGGWPDGF